MYFADRSAIGPYPGIDDAQHHTGGQVLGRAGQGEAAAPQWNFHKVLVGRDGAPMFGNKGFHRLSIAKLANVKDVTVMVGVVHQEAVENGGYANLYKRFGV